MCTMGKRKRNVCPQIYVNCCKHPPPPPPVPCPLLPRHPFHPSTQSPPSIKMSRPKKRAAITQQNNNPTTFSKKDNNNKKYQHQNWNVSKIIQSESNPNPIRIQSESNPNPIHFQPSEFNCVSGVPPPLPHKPNSIQTNWTRPRYLLVINAIVR